MSELRFELFQGPSGLDRLARAWRHLFDRLEQPSYVHLWEWHQCALEALARAPGEVLFCALYDGAELVAIVPLEPAVERIMGVDLATLRLPTHPHMPHSDVLVHPRARTRIDLRALARQVARATGRRWDLVLLEPVLADSAAAAVIAARPVPLCMAEPVGLSDALPTMPYQELLEGLSKNFRASLRKARNKLGKLAGVRMSSAHTPAEREAAFAAFLELEASGWKGAQGTGTAIQLDPALRRFYGQLVDRLGPSGQCQIHLLEQDGRAMAAQFSLQVGERCYLLKIGYDEAYRHLAPGNMLLERLLERYQSDPVIRHVDLVSDAAWHRSWNPVARQVLRYLLFQPTPRGLAAWSALRGKQVLRPVYYSLEEQRQELVRHLAEHPHALARFAARYLAMIPSRASAKQQTGAPAQTDKADREETA